MCSGIISAIAFCPSHTKMLATGSYSQTTAIYGEDNMELLYILHGQEGGVTHVSDHIVIHFEFFLYFKQLTISSTTFDRCNSQKMVTIYILGAER